MALEQSHRIERRNIETSRNRLKEGNGVGIKIRVEFSYSAKSTQGLHVLPIPVNSSTS